MYCGNCGTANDAQYKFCQSCGNNLQGQSVNVSHPGIQASVESGYILEYAGFFRRLAALAIDGILLSILLSLLNWIFSSGLANFIFFFAGAAYFIILESSPQQATLGKSLMRIKVSDINGQQISIQQAAIRYFSKIISAVILYIGFIMAAFTQQKQGLHDIIAKTLVIKS